MDRTDKKIKIHLNGVEKEISAQTTLAALLEELQINPVMVAAELDGTIVNRKQFAETTLTSGAVLELVRFVGGGSC